MKPVEAVIDAAGARVPRVMERIERRMTEVSVDHGAALARHASRLEGFGIRPDAIELFVVDEQRRQVRRGD